MATTRRDRALRLASGGRVYFDAADATRRMYFDRRGGWPRPAVLACLFLALALGTGVLLLRW